MQQRSFQFLRVDPRHQQWQETRASSLHAHLEAASVHAAALAHEEILHALQTLDVRDARIQWTSQLYEYHQFVCPDAFDPAWSGHLSVHLIKEKARFLVRNATLRHRGGLPFVAWHLAHQGSSPETAPVVTNVTQDAATGRLLQWREQINVIEVRDDWVLATYDGALQMANIETDSVDIALGPRSRLIVCCRPAALLKKLEPAPTLLHEVSASIPRLHELSSLNVTAQQRRAAAAVQAQPIWGHQSLAPHICWSTRSGWATYYSTASDGLLEEATRRHLEGLRSAWLRALLEDRFALLPYWPPPSPALLLTHLELEAELLATFPGFDMGASVLRHISALGQKFHFEADEEAAPLVLRGWYRSSQGRVQPVVFFQATHEPRLRFAIVDLLHLFCLLAVPPEAADQRHALLAPCAKLPEPWRIGRLVLNEPERMSNVMDEADAATTLMHLGQALSQVIPLRADSFSFTVDLTLPPAAET